MHCVAVYLPEFPVIAWQREHADVHDTAVVVLEGAAPLERVFSRNYAAAQLGIAHGMSKVQAETSGVNCFVKRNFVNEQQAFADILAMTEKFSPRVEAVASPAHGYAGENSPSACFLLDRSGTERLLGRTEQYAARLMQCLKEQNFSGNVAAASNAEASLLLARSYPGITCVADTEIQTKLSVLPVASLQMEDSTLEIFHAWGIRTLGQLAALPEDALISRIGQQGRRLQQLAHGVADHLLVAEEAAFTLAARAELENPVELLESLLFVVSPLIEQLIRRAIDHAYALRSLTVELTLDTTAPHSCRIQPALPSTNRDLLLKLLNLQLQAHPPTAAILGVSLTAEPARPQIAQRGLFQAQFPDPDKLDLLTARLRSIAGEHAVGSPSLRNSYCPDDFELTAYKPGVMPDASMSNGGRLAYRCMRPAPLIKVRMQDGAPCAIDWNGVRMQVAEAVGPWQASGFWWDARQWEMDEWDAVIAEPAHTLRLRHEPALSRWSIAGIYD